MFSGKAPGAVLLVAVGEDGGGEEVEGAAAASSISTLLRSPFSRAMYDKRRSSSGGRLRGWVSCSLLFFSFLDFLVGEGNLMNDLGREGCEGRSWGELSMFNLGERDDDGAAEEGFGKDLLRLGVSGGVCSVGRTGEDGDLRDFSWTVESDVGVAADGFVVVGLPSGFRERMLEIGFIFLLPVPISAAISLRECRRSATGIFASNKRCFLRYSSTLDDLG